MLNITIQELRAFLALSKTLNFTSAAAVMNISQPAFSYKLQQLEEKLGVKLFNRTSRQVTVTQSGTRVLLSIERLVENYDHTVNHIQLLAQEELNRIVVACSEGIAAPIIGAVIDNFKRQFPDISIIILDDADSRVYRHIISGAALLGITSYWKDDPEFLFEPFMQEQLCVVCLRGHPLAKQKHVMVKDLAEHPFIALNRESDTGQLIEKLADRAEIKLNTAFDVTHMSTLIGMVKAGLGITVVSKLKMSAFDSDSLIIRPLIDAGNSYDVGVVSPVGRALAPPIVKLRDELLINLRKSYL